MSPYGVEPRLWVPPIDVWAEPDCRCPAGGEPLTGEHRHRIQGIACMHHVPPVADIAYDNTPASFQAKHYRLLSKLVAARAAALTTSTPRAPLAAPARRVPPWSASDTPRPAIAAARPGMTQLKIANTPLVRATTIALYRVGSPPPVVCKVTRSKSGTAIPTMPAVTRIRTRPPGSQPILNSVKKAVGCRTPQGISTAPTMTAIWYSIMVTIRSKATKEKSMTMPQ